MFESGLRTSHDERHRSEPVRRDSHDDSVADKPGFAGGKMQTRMRHLSGTGAQDAEPDEH